MMPIKIIIKQGDIVFEKVDAVVNAANNSLSGGGGVDGAIHSAAGWDELDEACRKIGYCGTGDAVITDAFEMKDVGHIIHTVGPFCSAHSRWTGEPSDKEKQLLWNCYYNSLKLADKYGCRTVAFPSIATGIFGFPLTHAPAIFLSTISEYEKENMNIEEVRMVCYDDETYESYRNAFVDGRKTP